MLEYKTTVDFCLDALAGKWKILIIDQLRKEHHRLAEILNEIPSLTKRVLIRQLREMEEDLVITRREYDESPARVEYYLTEHGKKLFPIIEAMNDWGMEHIKKLENKEIRVITAYSIDELKEKISGGGEEIEKLKEQTKSELNDLDNEMLKRGKRSLNFGDE